jgi:hypothetical protein
MPADSPTPSNESKRAAGGGAGDGSLAARAKRNWKMLAVAVFGLVAMVYLAVAVAGMLGGGNAGGAAKPEVERMEQFAARAKGSPAGTPVGTDGGRLFRELVAAAGGGGGAGGLSRADYVRGGGTTGAFDVLDRDGNGELTDADFAAPDVATGDPVPDGASKAGPGATALTDSTPFTGVKRFDRRTGVDLMLDETRAGWLQELEPVDAGGNYRFRAKSIAPAAFGSGTFGTLTIRDREKGPDTTKSLRCFFRKDSARGLVLTIDSDGNEARFKHAEGADAAESDVIRWDREEEAPETLWFRETRKLSTRANFQKADAWAVFALKLAALPGMAEEARDAAKRALIYDPARADLYAIVGVERREGKLLRKGN